MYIPFRRWGTTGFPDWLNCVTWAWVLRLGLGHTFWSSLMTSASDWDGKPRGDTAYSEIERENGRGKKAQRSGRRLALWHQNSFLRIDIAHYKDLSWAFHIPMNFVDWKTETILLLFYDCNSLLCDLETY